MAHGVNSSAATPLPAHEIAPTLTLRYAPNGVRYASLGESKISASDLDRIVETVPFAIAPALADRVFYFVPLAIPDPDPVREPIPLAASDLAPGARPSTLPRIEAHHAYSDRTLIAPLYTADLAEEAVCHRNVTLPDAPGTPAHEGVFISAALLQDKFALAFEFFINVGHAFVESQESTSAIPEAFLSLAWSQALAGTRGETSQDSFEARTQALSLKPLSLKPESTDTPADHPDHPTPQDPSSPLPDSHEKAKRAFLEAAFADALAIYQLSLAVDFDYSELREREYPLLAPAALADRLRLMARLFPPNPSYDFSIRYRRRS